MSEPLGRDWTRMTRSDFDRAAPPHPDGPTPPVEVPDEPDAYGTPSLFTDEPPAQHPAQ